MGSEMCIRDSNGNMTVISWTGGVYQFDGAGNLQNSYDPDPTIPSRAGKSRSMAFAFQNVTTTLLGDVNLSGAVTFADIPPFIEVLISGEYQAEADIDQDLDVDFDDIAPLVTILIGQ